MRLSREHVTSAEAVEDDARSFPSPRDVRAAQNWVFSDGGDADVVAALTAVSVPFWIHLSLVDECRRNPDPKAVAAYYPDRIEIVRSQNLPASRSFD
jgi:predicted ATPase